jgi:hypothetical protein
MLLEVLRMCLCLVSYVVFIDAWLDEIRKLLVAETFCSPWLGHGFSTCYCLYLTMYCDNWRFKTRS